MKIIIRGIFFGIIIGAMWNIGVESVVVGLLACMFYVHTLLPK